MPRNNVESIKLMLSLSKQEINYDTWEEKRIEIGQGHDTIVRGVSVGEALADSQGLNLLPGKVHCHIQNWKQKLGVITLNTPYVP